MNERLLQFIWQFQYFNRASLTTASGQALQILQQGTLNHNQGPDFTDARIKIDDTTWVGNIELHVQSSQWHQHHHSTDKNYENIILHVVWHNDDDILDVYGQVIPALELQTLVPKVILQRFELLMRTADFIPCSFTLPVLDEISWLAWKERLVIERLEEKSSLIAGWLQQANHHWEEVFWRSLARSFGMKVNAEVFEQVSCSLPMGLLAKHKNQIHQLEALLLGQAGLLESSFTEKYVIMLQKEYSFLAKKYDLKPVNRQPDILRMRPHNFPAIRFAQLAMLVHQSSHLFSKIKTAAQPNEVFQWFDVAPNDFWNYHYTLTDEAAYYPKSLARSFIQHIIINSIIPVFFAYGRTRNEHAWKEKAVHWLMQLSSEQNSVTKQWKAHRVENKTAFDSQALIQLKNTYCNNKKCLDCAVGARLLKE